MGYTKEAEIIWNKICDKFSKDRNKTMITRTMAYEMINEALAQNLKQPDVSGELPLEQFSDTEADGVVFCGKCGKQK